MCGPSGGRAGSSEQQLARAILIQAVYDKAYANGITEENLVYDPDSGVFDARIVDGKLIETIERVT